MGISFSGENIWIIGCSSGIGRELAKQLAAKNANLIMSARRKEELQILQQDFAGSNHKIYPMDVANEKQVNKVTEEVLKQFKKIDRVIFMAGIYTPENITNMDMNITRKIIEVNLMGAIYCVNAILPILKKQNSGQIALCASVAGYIGLPNGQPYSASKAALINFTESLFAEISDNIDVKLINPGFVKTPMTSKNDFYMPFCIDVNDAAKAIIKGLRKKSFEIHFPKRLTLLLKAINVLPYFLKLSICKAIVRRG